MFKYKGEAIWEMMMYDYQRARKRRFLIFHIIVAIVCVVSSYLCFRLPEYYESWRREKERKEREYLRTLRNIERYLERDEQREIGRLMGR